jgi:hypothetical protein
LSWRLGERNGHGKFGDGGPCSHQASFDLDAEHGRILRIAPPATDGKADLSGGLLREVGEGDVRRGHAGLLLSVWQILGTVAKGRVPAKRGVTVSVCSARLRANKKTLTILNIFMAHIPLLAYF